MFQVIIILSNHVTHGKSFKTFSATFSRDNMACKQYDNLKI